MVSRSGSKFDTDDDASVEEPTVNTDQALAKAIDFMNSDDNIDIKSDIPEQAIPYLVALKIEEDFTKSEVMSKFVEKFKILRVSKNRESRKEIIELAKNRRDEALGNTGLYNRTMNWLRGNNGQQQM